ncbi:MAG: SufD family Fe-S cluster assembly protein [Anaerocolumna sp.]
MKLKLNNLNKLPVRTWSWLKVNDASLMESIPDMKAYTKNPVKSNTTLLGDISINSDISELDIFSSMDIFPSMDTGMGAEAVDFIKECKNSGISVRVPSGMRIEEPVYLEYNLDEDDSTVVDLNYMIAEAGSEITVVMVYRSKEECPGFHGGLTYLMAGENAVINFIQIQLLNEKVIHLNNIGAKISEGGIINLVQGELGGLKVMTGLHADLVGNNSSMDINTIFFGDKSRSLDFNYVVNQFGRLSKSEMVLNGALLDDSRKVFRGTLDFKKGAAGAVGHEREFTLLFSPGIKNVSAPLILCGEENVEGKHAANSGKIDENKLFYMMSRGLDEVTAKKLIIEAWFEPAIGKIPYTSLQNEIIEYMKERLSHVKSIQE